MNFSFKLLSAAKCRSTKPPSPPPDELDLRITIFYRFEGKNTEYVQKKKAQNKKLVFSQTCLTSCGVFAFFNFFHNGLELGDQSVDRIFGTKRFTSDEIDLRRPILHKIYGKKHKTR